MDYLELIKTALTLFVFPFLVKWLVEKRKGDLAKRIATIARDIAGSVYAQFPTWDEALLIQEIARALEVQFPKLSDVVLDRVAWSALKTVKQVK
jgi:hypothetical protein